MKETKFIVGIIILVLVIIGGSLWGIPKYRIYKQDLAGQANLRQQEWEKKIAIEEARALKESAILRAEAEIERAKGVAEANRIIGDSLKGNDEYLRYLWIDGLQTNEQQVIYIPTEAGLPILEAGKRY
ncbi:membrane protease subunit [Patescibacteria group bacterium]|nr:membrane protease subunit [Patescibacteria group bacterium]